MNIYIYTFLNRLSHEDENTLQVKIRVKNFKTTAWFDAETNFTVEDKVKLNGITIVTRSKILIYSLLTLANQTK